MKYSYKNIYLKDIYKGICGNINFDEFKVNLCKSIKFIMFPSHDGDPG